MQEKSRNFGLDLMRSVAILCVLIHHWKHHLTDLIPAQIHLVHFFGYIGVEMFFVLSGFLIGNILIRHFLNEEFTLGVVKNFWLRRWLRTLPLYYFILIVNIVLARESPLNYLKYFVFLQNFTRNTFAFFSESWSLAIEEWFYLTFPIALWLLNKFFKSRLEKRKILLSCICLYILLFTAIRIAQVIRIDPQWNLVIRPVVLYRLDSIAYGVLGSYIFIFNQDFWHKIRNWSFTAGLLLIIAAIVYFNREIAYNYFYLKGDTSFFAKTFYFSIVSTGFLMLVPFLYYIKTNNELIKTCVTYVSKTSYSVYLINLYFVVYLNNAMNNNGWRSVILVLAVFIGLNMFFSYFTYRFIEQFFLKLRDRIWKEKYKAI